MYIFFSNSTWFEKKSFFINFAKLVGKKSLNFVQMANVFTD